MDPSQNHASPQTYYQPVHDQAVALGQHHYTDPRTGFLVFTELYLSEQGRCCLSGCRHCPYGFKK
jgi:hypothetical protein